jgi:uncharacterized delta-60 repeat protein
MINNIVLQPDEKILISGEPSKVANVTSSGVQRLDAQGAHDFKFVPPIMGSNDMVTAIARFDDGSIVIGGTFLNATSSKQYYLAGLDPNGFYEHSEGWFESEQPNGAVLSLATTPSHKVLVGGEFSDLKGHDCHALARLNGDGSMDLGFVTSLQPKSAVHSVMLQGDQVLIGGNFCWGDNENGLTNFARLKSDGSLDVEFSQSVDDWVFSVLPAQDGSVMIGGVFKSVGGVERKYLARFHADGVLDKDFAPDFGLLGWVYTMAQQADGRLLIGGEFTSIDDVEINHIARLNKDGSLDTSFMVGAGANDSVKVITLQEDGKILIGGEFTAYDGEPRRHIARLNSDGTLDRGFGDDRV